MSTLNVANISDGTDTVETGYVVHGSAKVWGSITGIGTAAINDSLNLSSLTDNGTGDYSLFFTTSFGSAFYSDSAGLVTDLDWGAVSRLSGSKNTGNNSMAFSPNYIANQNGDVNYSYSAHGDLA